MIMRVAAAAYGVLLLDLLMRVQMIANPGKTRNSHLIAIKTSPTVTRYARQVNHLLIICRRCGFKSSDFISFLQKVAWQ